jgi:hypothetical protein
VRVVDWQDADVTAVESRDDLARYLVDLAGKVRESEISTENPSTEAFIDAAGRWTKAMEGFFSNVLKEPVPDSPDWAMVAAIFRAALVYE